MSTTVAKILARLRQLPLSTLIIWAAGLIFCTVSVEAFHELGEAILRQTGTGATLPIDSTILNVLHDLHSPTLDVLAIALTTLGYFPIVMALTVIVDAIWIRAREIVSAITLTIIVMGAPLIDTALKGVYQRHRPIGYMYLITESDYSFPSGHSFAGMAFYVGFAFLLTYRQRWRIRILAVATSLLLAVCIAASRVYFGVHFPTDVLGGLLMGLVWVVLVLLGSSPWRKRTPERAPPSAASPWPSQLVGKTPRERRS